MNHKNKTSVGTNAVVFLPGGIVNQKKRRVDLDKYDVAILSALATDARLTTVELAEKVHLSRTAVSRRISAMKRAQVLNKAAEVLNYELLGFDVHAVVEIKVRSQMAESLREQLLVQPEVLAVVVVAGCGLLCLDVIAVDMNHLHSFIHSLQSSGDTSTKIVYAKDKSPLTLLERMRMLNERAGNSLELV